MSQVIAMEIRGAGCLVKAFCPIFNSSIVSSLYLQTRNYASRKGTRARKEALWAANKRKNDLQRAKHLAKRSKIDTLKEDKIQFKDDSTKLPIPAENVYAAKYYRWKVYSFADAILAHRETHHPTIYNCPDAPVQVKLDLNLLTQKKTKFIERINGLALLPHIYKRSSYPNILFLAEDINILTVAKNAGADMVAGKELVKQIQTGAYSLEEHDYCLAHPDILPHLQLAKGVFKNKYPTPNAGTLSIDVEQMVTRHRYGSPFSLTKSKSRPVYGFIESQFGTLDMDVNQLEENLVAFIAEIMSFRRNMKAEFLLRGCVKSPPSPESFKINLDPYMSKYSTPVENIPPEHEEIQEGVIEAA